MWLTWFILEWFFLKLSANTLPSVLMSPFLRHIICRAFSFFFQILFSIYSFPKESMVLISFFFSSWRCFHLEVVGIMCMVAYLPLYLDSLVLLSSSCVVCLSLFYILVSSSVLPTLLILLYFHKNFYFSFPFRPLLLLYCLSLYFPQTCI